MGKYLLKICERQLNLRNTLINGQCFNWTKVSDNLYSGVIFQQYLEVSRQDPHTVCVQVYPDKTKNFEKVLEKYFKIEINLQKLQNKWCVGNQHLKGICQKIPGIRILQQDPWQCTISFICSQNNNISRITKLLFSLREKYGKFIIEKHNQKHYAFPTLEDLKEAKAQHLRDMGFGYRAQFLIQAIAKVNSHGGSQWLNDLRGQKHETVRNQLIGFKGVGRKVADCISLFSMDCHSSVPVDTHIFQIAKKLGYIKQNTDKKSLSDTLYKRISDCYVQKYGEYAGWAQQILFAGDLVMFKDKLKQPKEPLVDDTQVQEQEVKPIRRKR